MQCLARAALSWQLLKVGLVTCGRDSLQIQTRNLLHQPARWAKVNEHFFLFPTLYTTIHASAVSGSL